MQYVYDNEKWGFDIGICRNQFVIALPLAVDWFPCNVKGNKFFSFSVYFLCFGLHFEFRKWCKMGKGDTFRPINKQKYDKNYLRIFGKKCRDCNGTGVARCEDLKKNKYSCQTCNGIGYIKRKK